MSIVTTISALLTQAANDDAVALRVDLRATSAQRHCVDSARLVLHIQRGPDGGHHVVVMAVSDFGDGVDDGEDDVVGPVLYSGLAAAVRVDEVGAALAGTRRAVFSATTMLSVAPLASALPPFQATARLPTVDFASASPKPSWSLPPTEIPKPGSAIAIPAGATSNSPPATRPVPTN